MCGELAQCRDQELHAGHHPLHVRHHSALRIGFLLFGVLAVHCCESRRWRPCFCRATQGPDGPHSAMFPDDPQYADLVALRALQERTQQREGAPTRQVAASAAAAGQDGGGIAGDCTAEGERPLTYIDPETYGKFSSTGLAKRVQGGAFSTSTRGIMVRRTWTGRSMCLSFLLRQAGGAPCANLSQCIGMRVPVSLATLAR